MGKKKLQQQNHKIIYVKTTQEFLKANALNDGSKIIVFEDERPKTKEFNSDDYI